MKKLLLTFLTLGALGCAPDEPLLDKKEDTLYLKRGDAKTYQITANYGVLKCDTSLYQGQQGSYRACAFDELSVTKSDDRCNVNVRAREQGRYPVFVTIVPARVTSDDPEPETFKLWVVVENEQIPNSVAVCIDKHQRENWIKG